MNKDPNQVVEDRKKLLQNFLQDLVRRPEIREITDFREFLMSQDKFSGKETSNLAGYFREVGSTFYKQINDTATAYLPAAVAGGPSDPHLESLQFDSKVKQQVDQQFSALNQFRRTLSRQIEVSERMNDHFGQLHTAILDM